MIMRAVAFSGVLEASGVGRQHAPRPGRAPGVDQRRGLQGGAGAGSNDAGSARRTFGIYLGYVHYRLLGATLVGIAFVPPSFLMVVALGWAYAQFGGLSAGLFAAWMRQHFFGLAFRHAYDCKSEKFTFPAPRLAPLVQPAPA